MKLIDLSHTLRPGMPAYPGLPEPKFHIFLSHADAARHATYSHGTTFQIAKYEFGGNTGTYVDSPFHRHPGGEDMSRLALEKLVNVPGLIVEAPGDGAIGPELFAKLDVMEKAVLVFTGWDKRWGGDYFRSGPFLTAAACEALVRAKAMLVGIDCANIDNMQDPDRPAHTILLAAGIPIVEHLRGLEQLRGQVFRFFAAPPAIEGGTSFPVRAFALCE